MRARHEESRHEGGPYRTYGASPLEIVHAVADSLRLPGPINERFDDDATEAETVALVTRACLDLTYDFGRIEKADRRAVEEVAKRYIQPKLGQLPVQDQIAIFPEACYAAISDYENTTGNKPKARRRVASEILKGIPQHNNARLEYLRALILNVNDVEQGNIPHFTHRQALQRAVNELRGDTLNTVLATTEIKDIITIMSRNHSAFAAIAQQAGIKLLEAKRASLHVVSESQQPGDLSNEPILQTSSSSVNPNKIPPIPQDVIDSKPDKKPNSIFQPGPLTVTTATLAALAMGATPAAAETQGLSTTPQNPSQTSISVQSGVGISRPEMSSGLQTQVPITVPAEKATQIAANSPPPGFKTEVQPALETPESERNPTVIVISQPSERSPHSITKPSETTGRIRVAGTEVSGITLENDNPGETDSVPETIEPIVEVSNTTPLQDMISDRISMLKHQGMAELDVDSKTNKLIGDLMSHINKDSQLASSNTLYAHIIAGIRYPHSLSVISADTIPVPFRVAGQTLTDQERQLLEKYLSDSDKNDAQKTLADLLSEEDFAKYSNQQVAALVRLVRASEVKTFDHAKLEATIAKYTPEENNVNAEISKESVIEQAAKTNGWSPDEKMFYLAAARLGLDIEMMAGIGGNAGLESDGYNMTVIEKGLSDEVINKRMKQNPGLPRYAMWGRGYFQWTFDRHVRLVEAAQTAGIDLNSHTVENAEFQLNFAINEMKRREPREGTASYATEWDLFHAIARSGDVAELTWQFQYNFERPAYEERQQVRIDIANEVYGQLNNAKLELQNSSKPNTPPAELSPGYIDVSTPENPGATIECAPGTAKLGFVKTKRFPEGFELCAVLGLPSSSEESTPGEDYYVEGADGHAIIQAQFSKALVDMIEAAKRDGIDLTATSSYRTNKHQRDLWNKTPNPKFVAPPSGHKFKNGKVAIGSFHESAAAIDLNTGTPISSKNCVWQSGVCTQPGDAIWRWLKNNAGKYGFEQYPNEWWHWEPAQVRSGQSAGAGVNA